MCGIAGIIKSNSYVNPEEIVAMTNAIKHRGPDGEGVFVHENFGIGHRRLAIIDLEGGKQPLFNNDHTLAITFNGEIYNFLDLKKELIPKGYTFKTNSDTEVILNAYQEWGVECVMKLRGMFAFGILDKVKNEIFLARDHFGIKPLVYAMDKGVFCFASELQALKINRDIEWSVSLTSLDQYLQFQYIPAPSTIYTNAFKLPPAHWMRINQKGEIIEKKRFWEFKFKNNSSLSADEWAIQLNHVIQESVNAHLVSDVPFGAFLSGGIDSTYIVSCMAAIMQQPVKTFSIGFKEESYNELKYARIVSDYWKTEHYEEIIEPDALTILPDLVKYYGEPFGDSSAIPTWYVSRLARQHVTMVLTGDAGDELFAGYQSYTNRWHRHIQPIPEHLSLVKKMLYPLMNRIQPKKYTYRTASDEDWMRYMHYYNDTSRKDLWKEDIQQSFKSNNREIITEYMEKGKSFTHFQKAQNIDFNTYLPYDILTKVDVASMMNSLETRTPLLDINVVEFASSIPEHLNIRKINNLWEGKLLMKKNLEKHFSKEFVYRSKMGFAIPVTDWFGFGGAKMDEVKDRLLSRQNGFSDLFKRNGLEKIANGNHSGKKWLLLFLQEWLSQQH
jgi:asparagine synthase (glutamine-hydrolysing)